MYTVLFFEIQKKSARTHISYTVTDPVFFPIAPGMFEAGVEPIFLHLWLLYFAESVQFMDHQFSIPHGLSPHPPILFHLILDTDPILPLSQLLPTQVSV